MDSFTEDLSSPLPKQMQHSEMMDDVRPAPSSVPTHDLAASTTRRVSEMEGRPAMAALRPLSERLSRIMLKRGMLACEELKLPISSEDPFRQLSDDLLEHVLARLPLFPLKAAKKVCKRWASVTTTPQFDSLHKELGEQQPWLVCYGLNHLVPSKSRGFAFDVESDAWVTLPSLQFPSHNSGSLTGANGIVYAIAAPGEDRLWYKLTSSTSSVEAFGDTWYETSVMRFPRCAPVVSVALDNTGIAHKVVVAGGVPEFEDEHRAVEVFDSETGTWDSYGDLPEQFSECSSRTWMSGVVCNKKFYVSLMHSGPMHVLDLYTRQWDCIQLERPENLTHHHVMAIGTTLVVAGLCTEETATEGPFPLDSSTCLGHEQYAVKLWKVDFNTRRLIQIGLMPGHLFATLGRSATEVPSLKFVMHENLVYVSMDGGELVVGEVSVDECNTRWRGLPSLSALGCRFDSVVTFCASLSILNPQTAPAS